MMFARINARPRRQNAGRPAIKSAPGYLKWLRGRSCHLEGAACRGRIVACHVDHAGDKGIATKVSDRHSLPMCDGHHTEQHRLGWPMFERVHGIDALGVSAAFWRAWPGRRDWEAAHVDA